MIRWSYVITRLMIVGVVISALWALLNPVLRIGLVHTGQLATGAQVEIQSLRTFLTRAKVEVGRIAIADPDSPMSNLVEIGHASFDLESGSALRRRLVISEGRLSDIEFHTGRDSNGQLGKKAEKDAKQGPGLFDKFGKQSGDWIDGSVDRLEERVEQEFESVRLARELEVRWPKEYDQLDRRVDNLSRRGKQLISQVETMSERPLDHLDKIQPALQQADQLRRDGMDLKSKLGQLRRQVAQDRMAVREAKEHDLKKVRKALEFKSIDGDQLSEYLLGSEIHDKISTALGWIQWSRSMVGSDKSANIETAGRGRNVVFPCMVRSPDMLIRKLVVDGGGTVDGKAFRFDGSIGDITHQPRRHDKPTTVKIRSNGAIELSADAILDRRGKMPTEHFVVDIPALAQPARTLGNADDLAVKLSAGHAQISVDLKIRGDAVAGTLGFRQDDVKVTPQLKRAYSKEILASNVDAAFNSIQNIRAAVNVSGDIKKPTMRLQSNLGPQLASGINAMIRSELVARERQLNAIAHAEVDQQLAKLQQKITERHGDILKQLELGDSELAMLKNEIAARVGAPSDVLDKGKDLLNLFRR